MFINSETAKLAARGKDKRVFSFVKMTGLQLQDVDFSKPQTEIYAFGPNNILDSSGKKICRPNYFWFPSLNIKTEAMPLFREIK